MWSNPRFLAGLVTFTEEILNGKLHFLCSDNSIEFLALFKNMCLFKNKDIQNKINALIQSHLKKIPKGRSRGNWTKFLYLHDCVDYLHTCWLKPLVLSSKLFDKSFEINHNKVQSEKLSKLLEFCNRKLCKNRMIAEVAGYRGVFRNQSNIYGGAFLQK